MNERFRTRGPTSYACSEWGREGKVSSEGQSRNSVAKDPFSLDLMKPYEIKETTTNYLSARVPKIQLDNHYWAVVASLQGDSNDSHFLIGMPYAGPLLL